MRSITTVIFSVFVVLCSGHFLTKQVKYADKEFLEKQKFVFDILQHIHQDDIFAEKYDEWKNFNIQENLHLYNKPEMVEEFLNFYKRYPLPAEEIFTAISIHHSDFARGLMRALYLAKDYETYKKTAIWGRFNYNKEAFVYAFTIGTLARDDMQGIVLPAVYEINPHYFFTAETIEKAEQYKMQGFHSVKKVEDMYTVAIPTNYTGLYGHINEDNLLSYFTEDIGLNSFYYYFNIDYPQWTKGRPDGTNLYKNDYRGTLYLYVHWQLLARYYLERLSHDLGEIEQLNWYTKLSPGYHSGLRYYNGVHFPNRDNDHRFWTSEKYDLIDYVQMLENRIMEAIDLERVILPDLSIKKLDNVRETVEILGNTLHNNEDSANEKFYGFLDVYLRYLVNEGIPYGKFEDTLPGAIMHYETSMRDPAFYSMYKRVLRIYWHYLEGIPAYTDKELGFDGVKIEGVEIDKLVTYYDKFDSDITNAVDVEPSQTPTSDLGKFGRVSQYQGQDFMIKARQYRLNHLPFTIKITVNSDKAQKAAVKIFLGPKYDHHGHKILLKHNRENFIELEHFVVELNAGNNVISRNSNDFSWYVNDRTTYFELYKKLMMATNNENYKFPLDMSEAHCGFPNRLLLPRGKKGGMTFQLFVMVTPYVSPNKPQFSGYDPVISCGIGSGARYVDGTTFGFPFDRKIDPSYWNVENIHFQDVLIYHKTESQANDIHH